MNGRFAYLAAADLRSAGRDPMLKLLLFAPFLLILVVRFGVPPLQRALLQQAGFDLRPHYPFILSLVPMLMPLMVGMCVGFMLLDERDEGTLTAIAVTCLSKSRYLFYKTLAPTLYAALLSYAAIHAAGLGKFSLIATIPGTVTAALLAPVLAYFLAACAENKVTGLVLAKAAGLLLVFPLSAYLLPGRWALVMAPTPSYWISLHFTLLAAGRPAAWLALAAGALYCGILLFIFVRVFEKRAF